jgi:predicted RNA-binding Zn-ribbon protein involved in translation (DUF1610 family)
MPPRKKKSYKFCPNCGQEVAGAKAAAAANPEVVFCSECGFKLAKEGTCPNPDCVYFGEVPPAV